MKIKNHKLVGDNVTYEATPKTSGEYEKAYPDTIIIHYTAGNSLNVAVNTLKNPRVKASAHIVIGREGEIVQMADFNIITWHAGNSGYKFPDFVRTSFNKYSIGIEICNDGFLVKTNSKFYNWYKKEVSKEFVFEGKHRNYPITKSVYWHTFTEKQIEVVSDICKLLMKEYPSIKYILGHEEIAPGRKTDPGPAFPLDELREKMKVWIPVKREEEKREELEFGTLAKVTAKINFRSGPGTQFDTVAEMLEKDEKVLVLSKQGEWYEVEQDITGWVFKEFIDRDTSDSIPDGEVNVNVLNIRSKPDGDKVAKPLTIGQKVKIIKEDKGWLFIQTRVTGWVFAKYIQIIS